MDGYLIIRAEGKEYGLRIDQVLLVADGFELYPAPSTHPAVRGVTPMRDRLVPLVHLAALLTSRSRKSGSYPGQPVSPSAEVR